MTDLRPILLPIQAHEPHANHGDLTRIMMILLQERIGTCDNSINPVSNPSGAMAQAFPNGFAEGYTAGPAYIIRADGALFATFDAGTTWRSLAGVVGTDGTLVGEIRTFAGSTEPLGWLFCAGQAISRTTYADLFSVIGTTYGVGNGSTTFNLPNLRGRAIIGLDNMGGTSANVVTDTNADSLGGTMGAETHTLSTAELAVHAHRERASIDAGSSVVDDLFTGNSAGGANPAFATAAFSLRNGGALNTGSAGSGNAHNNMQPSMAMNYLIKY